MAEQTLTAVIHEAPVQDVSTRSVDPRTCSGDLVRAMGGVG